MFEFVKCQYLLGNLTDAQLDMLTAAGKLTAAQAETIRAAK